MRRRSKFPQGDETSGSRAPPCSGCAPRMILFAAELSTFNFPPSEAPDLEPTEVHGAARAARDLDPPPQKAPPIHCASCRADLSRWTRDDRGRRRRAPAL